MKIEGIDLNGYNAFAFNRIKKFRMTATDPIQIIVGTNGCGKSSLMRELNPFPPASTSFEKGGGGLKILRLSHKGDQYVLTSDFTTSANAHSFVMNATELNISGTMKVQEDLIKEHLGYSQLIHDLVSDSIRFAEMAPGMRKNLLVNINPYNITLLVDHYKRISSHIRGLKGTLKLMHKRKAELLPRLLDEDTLKSLVTEKDGLVGDIDMLSQMTYALGPHVRRLEEEWSQIPSVSTEALLRDIPAQLREIKSRLPLFKDVPRDPEQLDREIVKCGKEKSGITSVQSEIESQLQGIAMEIDRYERLLREKEASDQTSALEDRIADLKMSMASLLTEQVDDPFSEEDLLAWAESHANLSDVLVRLCDFRGTIIKRSEAQTLRGKVISAETSLQAIGGALQSIDRQIDEARSHLEPLEMVGMPHDCANRKCTLFVAHMRSVNTLKDNLTRLQERREKLAEEHEIVKRTYNTVNDQLTVYIQYAPLIETLESLYLRNPYLRKVVTRDLVDILNDDPMILHTHATKYVELSKATHLYRNYTNELQILEAKYQSVMESQDTNTGMLSDILSEKIKSRGKLEVSLSQLQLRHQRVSAREALLSLYKTDKESVQQGAFRAEQAKDRVVLDHCIQHYKLVLRTIESVKNDFIEKLASISATVFDQDKLRARFDEEVIANIDSLEKEIVDYEKLEAATSPFNGIPHRYMVTVINAMIANMNYFIKLVFNYRFELVLLSEKKGLDYKFSALVGDDRVRVPDISTCSSAQLEMIDLAFMLAAMIQMKITDYPIFLDECGKTFDEYHKQRLLGFLKDLIDNKTVSQMFMINHHAVMHEGLRQSEVLVLNEDNVIVPPIYNQHVEMS